MPDNSVDSIVTDPPYFLTNSSGSGFMGKEWDSLSVKNAFAESLLRSLKPVWLTGEANSVQENVSTSSKKKKKGNFINALYVNQSFIDQKAKLNQSTFSAQENVLTKAEVLALSKELFPDLTKQLKNLSESVLFVVNFSFLGKKPKNIAQEIALKLHTNQICEDIKTLHSLMEEAKKKDASEVKIGTLLEKKFIGETVTIAKDVVKNVLEERYSATISSPIEFQKIMKHLTSLHCVKNAMALFMENPANIQILSERFHSRWLDEAIRVLKPGGHLLSFAGTRTYHPLARACEMSGFEIRDQIMWLYGSGFPKSHNISKAIDKKFGAERPLVQRTEFDGTIRKNDCSKGWKNSSDNSLTSCKKAVTDLAKQYDGWGTALKPANEPIVLARKPLSEKTIVNNVLKWGTGGINIDECRVGLNPGYNYKNGPGGSNKNTYGKYNERGPIKSNKGRFPANIILDEQAAEVLDEHSGISKSPSSYKRKEDGGSGIYKGKFGQSNGDLSLNFGDSGGASRFFYCAKASKRERNEGLELLIKKPVRRHGDRAPDTGRKPQKQLFETNNHPTVKPIKLMEYLVKLITPKGGTVLDPFMGSGTTGIAAKNLGFDFLGIELSEEYFKIAEARINNKKEKPKAPTKKQLELQI